MKTSRIYLGFWQKVYWTNAVYEAVKNACESGYYLPEEEPNKNPNYLEIREWINWPKPELGPGDNEYSAEDEWIDDRIDRVLNMIFPGSAEEIILREEWI